MARLATFNDPKGTSMSSVDVFVPCYRYGHFLRQWVASVLAQSRVDIRVLILDDASLDNTAVMDAHPEVEFALGAKC